MIDDDEEERYMIDVIISMGICFECGKRGKYVGMCKDCLEPYCYKCVKKLWLHARLLKFSYLPCRSCICCKIIPFVSRQESNSNSIYDFVKGLGRLKT